jgi:hypothetical protein
MSELKTINTNPTEEEIALLMAQDSQDPENVAEPESHPEDGANVESGE